MTDNPYRDRAIRMMRDLATRRRDEPVTLSSGEQTWVYLDVKGVLTRRWQMNLAADAMLRHVEQFRPTAIGGPTMGADVLSHVMISRAWNNEQLAWFSVRDKRKTTHGLGLWIEGHRLGPDDRVVITDDVASTGRSLVEAYERVTETGATVVAIAPFVDRSGVALDRFIQSGYEISAPYSPLMTHEDLGLEPLARKPVLRNIEIDNWSQDEAAMGLIDEQIKIDEGATLG